MLGQKYKPQNTSFPNAVKGCNVSFWRQDFIDINGCDESFEGWGGEDLEVIARMMNNGVSSLKVRHIAIVYHLYHDEKSRDREYTNRKLYESIHQNKTTRCRDGIDKYLSTNM